jgi:hypothetical protein
MAKQVTKAAKIGGKPKTRFGYYPTYKFKDHDPILDKVDTLFELSGSEATDGKPLTFETIAAKSQVAKTTLTNWRKRKVKRPQFATVAAVMGALGGEIVVKFGDQEVKGIRRIR